MYEQKAQKIETLLQGFPTDLGILTGILTLLTSVISSPGFLVALLDFLEGVSSANRVHSLPNLHTAHLPSLPPPFLTAPARTYVQSGTEVVRADIPVLFSVV